MSDTQNSKKNSSFKDYIYGRKLSNFVVFLYGTCFGHTKWTEPINRMPVSIMNNTHYNVWQIPKSKHNCCIKLKLHHSEPFLSMKPENSNQIDFDKDKNPSILFYFAWTISLIHKRQMQKCRKPNLSEKW